MHLQKPEKILGFLSFLGSEAVQDSLGMAKKTTKRDLKSSKIFKQIDAQMGPFFNMRLANFGPKNESLQKIPANIGPGHSGLEGSNGSLPPFEGKRDAQSD
jgi:hypothetical protein